MQVLQAVCVCVHNNFHSSLYHLPIWSHFRWEPENNRKIRGLGIVKAEEEQYENYYGLYHYMDLRTKKFIIVIIHRRKILETNFSFTTITTLKCCTVYRDKW